MLTLKSSTQPINIQYNLTLNRHVEWLHPDHTLIRIHQASDGKGYAGNIYSNHVALFIWHVYLAGSWADYYSTNLKAASKVEASEHVCAMTADLVS